MEKSGQRIHCIIHVGGKTSEAVFKFNDELWKTTKRAADQRLSRWKDSKYKTICENLPEIYGDSDGFHRKCYRNFTAIPSGTTATTVTKTTPESSAKPMPLLRSEVERVSLGGSGIFVNKCLFCGKVTRGKNRESLGLCESDNAAENIKAAARKLNDVQLLTKIAGVDFHAKEVRYHHSCRRLYLKKADDAVQPSTSQTDKSCRNVHNEAFTQLVEYVQFFIIDGQQSEMLPSVFQRYLSYLSECGISETPYTKQKLEDKLLNHFSGVLKSGKRSNKEGKILYSGNDADNVSSVGYKVNDVALHLRRMILDLQKDSEELPHPLTPEAAAKGQSKDIDLLTQFFRVLYTGKPVTRDANERVERYVNSSADDAIYATTRGLIKPAKHVLLGLGLKSLIGSRRVIEIMNRFGHSIGYHVAEGLETELAMSVKERAESIPDGLLRKAGLATGLAWDNYDENTETLSGSGTLHDTVGICYQNIVEETAYCNVDRVTMSAATSLEKIPRRFQKRKFEAIDDEASIDPYRPPKKPKIGGFDYDVKSALAPPSLQQAKRRDMIWTLLCHRYSDTPMWAGWNSYVTTDDLPKQNIGYMENLCLPPTRLDVVVETLRISQKVAEECNEKYAIVHYDLAIAKPAMQIQYKESPRFDNLFICFGPFHIELAFFGAIGNILSESGGPHILEDTGVLAGGSVNGFISGKHYNRCKRLHPLLALALRLLHIDRFLQEQGPIPDALLQSLSELHDNPMPSVIEAIEQRADHEDFLRSYDEYCEKTRSGTHGSTAQFWLMYVELIELYLVFSRSYRTNDVDLFIHTLERMCPVFFATNRPNYARWMTRYHLNLLNMDSTHPDIREDFKNGALSVRRTDKCFSRTPVDLTLEQTVNADAASRLTGITAFNQSVSARKRWMITRTVRSSIVGHLLTKVGLVKEEDVHKDTRRTRVERDNLDLQKLIAGVNETMNPFDEDVADTKLYCISTGQVMSEDIKDGVLTRLSQGESRYNAFKDECLADPTRFEKPISKLKCKTFASAMIKTKLKAKDKKIIELKGTRDLFGRLVILATESKVDLQKVFEYPLTPVPLTLAQIDGSMNKTDKSKLMHNLEDRYTETRPPPPGHVYMQDAMFLLQALVNCPETFGAIAKVILTRLCKVTSSEIHFVCDTYPTGSIKDIERACRAKGEVSDLRVTGADQRRPKDFSKLLRSSVFKTSFIEFLSEEWKRDTYAEILGNKTVIMGLEKVCYYFRVGENGSIIRYRVEGLDCNHEEADTRLALHLAYVAEHAHLPDVVIRCNDTDVLVILLYHLGTGNIKANVWMDAGVDGNNTRRYVDVTGLSKELGPDLCSALPGIHSFTGCDYTAAFLRKGKVRPLKLMEKSYIALFAELGDSPTVTNISGFEAFVCDLYGKPKTNSISAVRFAIFRDKYAPTNTASPLDKLRGADSSVLPPSRPVLVEKVRRTNYVSYMWKKATDQYLPDLNPTDHGWEMREGHLALQWFKGAQIPDDISQALDTETFTQDVEEDDELLIASFDSDSADSDYED